jgi:sigma-B regulation protein RsbU (phosphoserine phosphatase)
MLMHSKTQFFEQARRELEDIAGTVIRTVLVVDDSRAQLKIVSSILRRWGYEVLEASNGPAALDAIAAHDVDLVLSDWMMPEMTGLELRERIAEVLGDRYVYFILLTSRSEKADIATALESGADDFLTKPLNVEELHARISSAERLLRTQRDLSKKNDLLIAALEELQGVYDSVDRDLVEARHLQQSLVPERHLRFDGAEVSLHLEPAGRIGGDLVGAFRVGDGRIGVFAVDVSGHGIASALMTARLASYFNGLSPERNVAMTIDDLGLYSMRPPEEVCAVLNDLLIEDCETDHYLTFVIADCDLNTGIVRMAQAGHPHPMVQRADGRIECIGDGGLPVGMFADAGYSAFETRLDPGERLLIYSDGITDSPTTDGTLGAKGLSDIVARQSALKGPTFLDALSQELHDRLDGQDFPDDISAVLVEFTGRSPDR